MIKVSVVVPVYNPGSYIDPLVDSLLGQTLGPEEFEAIFVDDGSTDDTPKRLDQLAADHPHLRVIHQPNSGWPGQPRNVGIDAARGEYVHFVDHDDYLAYDALERLYDRAVQTSADVAIGRVVGQGRGTAYELFDQRRDQASLASTRLEMTLTPHKLFSTAMLNKHCIRFPEGKRRLEDYPFVLRSYFAAGNVVTLGGRPCYFFNKRSDGLNSSSTRIDPAGYYRDLREAIDVIEANTEPGALRDRMLRRFYDRSMLRKLQEPRILRLPADYRKKLFDEVRSLAEERFPASVAAGLPLASRLRAQLVHRGDLSGLVTFGERCAQIVARAEFTEARWREDDVLGIEFTAELGYPDGQPLRLLPVADGWRLDPRLTEGLFDRDAADFASAEALERTASLKLVLHDRDAGTEWRVPCSVESHLRSAQREDGSPATTVRLTGAARVDPSAISPTDAFVPRRWKLAARVALAGFARSAGLYATGSAAVEMPSERTVGEPARPVRLFLSRHRGELRLDNGSLRLARMEARRTSRKARPGMQAETTRSWARRKDGQLHVEVCLPGLDATAGTATQLRLRRHKKVVDVPAELRTHAGRSVVVADVPARSLRTGTWRLSIRPGESGGYKRVDARLVLHPRNPAALLTGTPPSPSGRPPRRPSAAARRAAHSLVGAADAVLCELPPDRAVRYRRTLERVGRAVKRANSSR